MAEVAEPENAPPLSEQWALQEKEADRSETSQETRKDVNPEVAEDVEPKVDENLKGTAEDANPNVTSSKESVVEKTEEASATEEIIESTDQEVQEEEEAIEERPVIKLETAPADFRFPTTNQTRHCFTRYIEYHRCINGKGEDAPECDKFGKYYRSLCPSEWIERWNEQRENGTFPGPL